MQDPTALDRRLLHPFTAILLLAGLLSVPTASGQQASDPSQGSLLQSNSPQTAPSYPQGSNSALRTGEVQQPAGTAGIETPRSMLPDPAQHVDRAGLRATPPDSQPTPAPESPTPFQLLVSRSLGTSLPLFGRNLFSGQPIDSAQPNAPPPTDYVVATGDQVLVRIWGPVTMNEALTIDRAGDIYLPQVGIIHLAGLPYSALDSQIRQSVSRVFRNYNLAVNLGSLHSIQIFITGEAARPGAYTVSSLSTLVNAVFASGGPSQVGSMRAIELRRENQTLTTFDFYDLLVHGDKSKDVHLLPGDVVFIPPVGPEVALGGQVKVPAIYEMKPGETLAALLSFAGGANSIASATSVSLEQIVDHNHREPRMIPLTPAGLATPVADGDLLVVGAISHAFEETVTIRGNVAGPGRFRWHPGMRLSEIIPDKASLLTPDYWDFRNAEGQRQPFFQPAPAANQPVRNQPSTTINLPDTRARDAAPTSISGGIGSSTLSSVEIISPGTDAGVQPLNRVTLPAPEIDWSYAVIERLDKATLRNQLLPFNLGRLVLDHDPASDLVLESGDVVTIFSQDDFRVADLQRTKFVRVEGEVQSAGVYSVRPGETLQSLVARAGGLSPDAYLFGSQFTRESARILQQQRLDEYTARLAVDMDRSAAQQEVSISQVTQGTAVLGAEERMLAQLRSQRATGRIVLDFKIDSVGLNNIPPLALENGDVLVVPSRPAVVTVIGSVSTQSSFLFEPGATVKRYLALAGGPARDSDRKHAFVIRASGAVVSRQSADFLSDSFERLKLAPGDTLVVPSKLFTVSRLRTILDSTNAISQLAVLAAAIAVAR